MDPRNILHGARSTRATLPVCDHYCGVEARMQKSLQLQAEMIEEFGACVFDVTLDCEDGAPAGGEVGHAHLVAELANNARRKPGPVPARVGVRLHPPGHAAFGSDAEIILSRARQSLSYIMLPKVETVADVQCAADAIDALCPVGASAPIPLHVLAESAQAVRHVFDIAAHPRVESVSFGLMDFVSSHAGAIGAQAMQVRATTDTQMLDQFHHPLVVRAKLEIASACHAAGKVPSHCVVTEFRDTAALERAARYAAQALGYTRMWSIHPDQIRPIINAFSPSPAEVDLAVQIVEAAMQQDWAPIAWKGTLHDRASYRYFWQVIERAHLTGRTLPASLQIYFSAPGQSH